MWNDETSPLLPFTTFNHKVFPLTSITAVIKFIIRMIVANQKGEKKRSDEFLESLSTKPYLFIGTNKIPKKLIFNSGYIFPF